MASEAWGPEAIEPLALLSDNYAWAILDPARRAAAIVDPSEAAPVREWLRARGLALEAILATHHHADHVGGITELLREWPAARVLGSAYDRAQGRIPEQTEAVTGRFALFGEEVHVLEVPGHTLGAIAYHLPARDAVFTGDTLFLAGCGRLFEGTAAQLHASLRTLGALPASTWIGCGHEYTEKNLRFAASILPDDPAIRARLLAVQAARRAGQPTVPAPLRVEQATNVFLRSDDPTVARAVGEQEPVRVFAELRRRRDGF